MFFATLRIWHIHFITVITHLTLLHVAPQRCLLIVVTKLEFAQQITNLLDFLAAVVPFIELAVNAFAKCATGRHRPHIYNLMLY